MLEVNLWAVLCAGLAIMVLGSLWYSTILFGKAWMQFCGLTEAKVKAMAEKKGVMARSYILALVTAFLTSYVLAHFLKLAGAQDFKGALEVVIWLWLGFIATVQLGSFLWEGKDFRLFLINTAYSLVSLLAASAILVNWMT